MVLSARWIQPKVGSFDRSLLKEALRRLFSKIRPSPIEWEPFKAMVPSCTVIAHCAVNGQMLSKARTALTAPLILQYILKKININGQMRNKKFLIVIYHFSLEKPL
jgi:hypothetical protein